MGEISVKELQQLLKDDTDDLLLLDVREPFEYRISNLNGLLIPLGQLPARIAELEPYKDKQVIVMCRSGARSAEACRFLEQRGFTNTKNLVGGINEWARKIDPDLPVY